MLFTSKTLSTLEYDKIIEIRQVTGLFFELVSVFLRCFSKGGFEGFSKIRSIGEAAFFGNLRGDKIKRNTFSIE